MMQEIFTGIRSTLVLWVLTAFLYPLLILAIGQGAFANAANGSLITSDGGQVVGSALIGQPFTTDVYFWGRPSTTTYSTGEDAAPTGISGASNLAPGSPDLLDRVQQEAERLRQAGVQPTADLLYASGSSLDPHISPEAALAQVERVAAARQVDPGNLEQLIVRYTEGRFLGIFGEPGVNVLKLNLALDRQ